MINSQFEDILRKKANTYKPEVPLDLLAAVKASSSVGGASSVGELIRTFVGKVYSSVVLKSVVSAIVVSSTAYIIYDNSDSHSGKAFTAIEAPDKPMRNATIRIAEHSDIEKDMQSAFVDKGPKDKKSGYIQSYSELALSKKESAAVASLSNDQPIAYNIEAPVDEAEDFKSSDKAKGLKREYSYAKLERLGVNEPELAASDELLLMDLSSAALGATNVAQKPESKAFGSEANPGQNQNAHNVVLTQAGLPDKGSDTQIFATSTIANVPEEELSVANSDATKKPFLKPLFTFNSSAKRTNKQYHNLAIFKDNDAKHNYNDAPAKLSLAPFVNGGVSLMLKNNDTSAGLYEENKGTFWGGGLIINYQLASNFQLGLTAAYQQIDLKSSYYSNDSIDGSISNEIELASLRIGGRYQFYSATKLNAFVSSYWGCSYKIKHMSVLEGKYFEQSSLADLSGDRPFNLIGDISLMLSYKLSESLFIDAGLKSEYIGIIKNMNAINIGAQIGLSIYF